MKEKDKYFSLKVSCRMQPFKCHICITKCSKKCKGTDWKFPVIIQKNLRMINLLLLKVLRFILWLILLVFCYYSYLVKKTFKKLYRKNKHQLTTPLYTLPSVIIPTPLQICKLRKQNGAMVLTHFKPMFPFYTPWKCQKTLGCLTFSGDIEREHWPEMG